MTGFTFDAYIIRVVDGDTAVVKPQVYRPYIYLYVRFKDSFAEELDDADVTKAEAARIAKEAAEKMFPQGSRVTMTNDRIHWTYERLEARIDIA